MKLAIATRFLTIAGTLLCASAVAQTRFCIGGDLDHLSEQQRTACSAKLQAVKLTAVALHAPADWHFVVVCGDEGWKSYTAYSLEGSPALRDASADTHLQERETFLRGDRLNVENLRSLRRVVAHEVAGIVLHSTDEVAIDRQMELWLNRDAQQPGL